MNVTSPRFLAPLTDVRKYVLKRQKLGIDMALQPKEALRLVAVIAAALNAGSSLPEEIRAAFGEAVHTSTSRDVTVYARGLYAAVRTNVGLSHAKAREYWIYRGPRQLLTTVCFIVAVNLINELFDERSFRDRVLSGTSSMLALLTALFMLYCACHAAPACCTAPCMPWLAPGQPPSAPRPRARE